MGTYIDIYVNDRFVHGIRNAVDYSFMGFFDITDCRIVSRTTEERRHLHIAPDIHEPVPELHSHVSILTDRLRVEGMGTAALRIGFDQYHTREIEWIQAKQSEPDLPEGYAYVLSDRLDQVSGLDFEAWFEQTQRTIAEIVSGAVTSDESPLSNLFRWMDESDPGLLLVAIARASNSNSEIVIDLSEELGHWISETDPEESLQQLVSEYTPTSLPLVATEGSNDQAVLKAAIAVLSPHLTERIRFFDFGGGPEGGASALTRVMKSFAAAGIENRTVAVYDNDTAGRSELLRLMASELPANLTAMTLPDLGSARSYPTLGPTGPAEMDVNGLAVSIELFFGSDVLEASGTSVPIRWTGHHAKLDQYQGAIKQKAALAKAFRKKAERALADAGSREEQDWDAMKLLVEAIVARFEELPSARYADPQSGELSDAQSIEDREGE